MIWTKKKYEKIEVNVKSKNRRRQNYHKYNLNNWIKI